MILFHGPKAGRGQGRDQLQRLQRLLRRPGRSVEICDDVAQATARIGGGGRPTVVVAAGGDGTLSLAAKMVMRHGGAVVPMPMGTENLLARRLGYSVQAEAVADCIAQNQCQRIDAMSTTIGHRTGLSLVMATAGFDASVVRQVHLRRRGHIRKWNYAIPIGKSIFKYPFGQITVHADDHQPIRCRWAMVFNVAAYAGNLSIAPMAKPDDGWLDVVCFQGDSVIDGVRYLAGIAAGRHMNFADVTNLRAKRVSFSSDQRIPIQCDGDYAGGLPAAIECMPGAIRMLRPCV